MCDLAGLSFASLELLCIRYLMIFIIKVYNPVMNTLKAKNLLLIAIILIASPMSLATASAHRSGCHRWHSCPSDTGSYVCGDLGYTSGCGTDTYSEPAQVYTPPATHIPVITTKSISTDESIPFVRTQKSTSAEYPDYLKIVTAGLSGVKRTSTKITFSDGVETSRSITGTETITQPIDEVTLVGSRMKPIASLNAVGITKKKDRFDIKGHSQPNSVVVLSLNGKRVKRANTDSKGNFVFKNIKLNGQSSKIVIYSRVNGQEKVISEPYTVTNNKHTFASEYQKLHG